MGQKNIVQTAVAAGKFKTLVALVKKAGLAGTLSAPGNLTVFAPTDQAFANLKKNDPALYNKVATNKKLLRSVLTYHVVSKRIPASAAIAAAKKGQKVKTVQGESIALRFKGGKIVLNGTARVVIPDVKASNGVIHAIGTVLVPPSLSQPPAPTQSIVQLASRNPSFSTLVSLVQKAGLVEAISAPGPFTVFAPTNEAFAKLAKAAPATYAAVLADPMLLAKVLTYHVVAGDIKSAQAIAVAQKNGSVKPLEGEPISLSLEDGKLTLNGSATVVAADVRATNGVIHVIDTVIVPPSLSA
jgi:transforming growth factor-beta-induced protein